MCKKHTQDSEIRPFCPGFRLKSLSFLTFSEKCKNQGSFCKCLIINKVLFLLLAEHGGSYENGASFYQPPFLSGKFTLKILTLQIYLMGWINENAGKFLSSIWIFTDILPSKSINSYRGNGGRSENADHFSTLAKNSVKFFSQKGFTRAFSLLFATYPNLAVITATRP